MDIAETIERLVTQDGFEFVVCEMKGAGRRRLLRVVVDHPNGVTLDQCAALSRRIGEHLDALDAVPTAYTLEVSSPGVERELYRLADYQRFTGHRVRLRTTVARNGRRLFRGRIGAVRTGEGPVIVLCDETGAETPIALSDIAQAQLEVTAEDLFRVAEEKRAARERERGREAADTRP
ncbi:ribosome maturation factor RimP [Chloracidobacterium aggregatum]|uniref:Ribosome maturation factor RimP n=1 Tax=Chloracidobacterium sp. N TaxID=2821540 RepID=A0ABX8B0E2_9BACT|nr:ribosome maturation factor RimP [Chloracidobacterium aggregatum]QUV85266.1 ribosome maturation factor RimP [Chloracidobacterium sp. 2]QUV88332.1 ribosome maturation factor RimP [Chloracidobacterium sp. S]QUV91252.1 ribosome maturation factor RimP [Chloracidobacterium sp. A]QUV94433.1 ribosome maturation factor RimP [Chloracidobacterium sp. N]